MKKHKEIIAVVMLITTFVFAHAQNKVADQGIADGKTKKLKASVYVDGGYENNIFKSTKRYFDLNTQKYLPKDSLIKSDAFVEVGADVDYKIENKKSYIDLGASGWYRNYFKNSKLNQHKTRLQGEYGYAFNDKVLAGVGYQISYSDRIAFSSAGDELSRSFKYVDNTGVVFAEYKFNKTNLIGMEIGFSNSKYVKEQGNYSLTNNQIDMGITYDKKLSKTQDLSVYISNADRHYLNYIAQDQTGTITPTNPLKHYTYIDVGAKYSHNITKTVTLIPSFDYSIRTDKYKGYYSYVNYDLGLNLRYSTKKIYFLAGFDWKETSYEIRMAPSVKGNETLVYKYIYTKLKFKYDLTDKIQLSMYISSDARKTNTELEYYRTRRTYNQYEVFAGIEYKIF